MTKQNNHTCKACAFCMKMQKSQALKVEGSLETVYYKCNLSRRNTPPHMTACQYYKRHL